MTNIRKPAAAHYAKPGGEIAQRRNARRPARSRTLGPRERLLASATELFCRQGFNAVGVDTIVEHAKTAKATLYKIFGSKEALVEQVLKSEGAAWREWFISSLDAAHTSPDQRVRAIFPLLAEWFQEKRFYGCPFINAVGEFDKSSDRIRSLALEHKMIVLDYIREQCAATGARDPAGLTHKIALLMDGAIVAAMITKDPRVALVAQDACITLLKLQ